MSRERAERGSSLLLALFACLGTAMLVLGLAAALGAVERALDVEAAGRSAWEHAEASLAGLARAARGDWRPGVVSVQDPTAGEQGELSPLVPASDWVLRGSVSVPALQSVLAESAAGRTPGPIQLSAWVERGRDGLDLPYAAVAGAGVCAAEGRTSEWVLPDMEIDPENGQPGDKAVVAVVNEPVSPMWGEGCEVRRLTEPWLLDEGSRGALDPDSGCATAPGVLVSEAGNGEIVRLPAGASGRSHEAPVLLVALGGAVLDLTDLGDVFGVIVGGSGSVWLEGTRVHGAVLTGGRIELGLEGQVIFDEEVLRWATDRSLVRTRLVPYSRTEAPLSVAGG